MMNRKAWTLGMALMAVGGGAQAGSVVYTSLASFNSAVPTSTLENLNGTPTGAAPISVGSISISELGASQEAGIYKADSGQGKSLQFTTAAGGAVRLTFSTAISAVGFNIYDLGDVGSTTLSYTLSNGDTGSFFSNWAGTNGNSLFAGLTSTSNFTYITLTNSRVGDFVEIDDVRYGSGVTSVPEPSSVALLCGGLGLISVRLMRKRKRPRRV